MCSHGSGLIIWRIIHRDILMGKWDGFPGIMAKTVQSSGRRTPIMAQSSQKIKNKRVQKNINSGGIKTPPKSVDDSILIGNQYQ